ncbi:SRPBCC family protein [Salinisphaera hydrothermalis]|uniref:Alcohol dehydrogenase zinc-binding domain-containing protein n=1 Tax=Salinisphaera hydrothermalis (strain C41B8) TaxID=1304275 RepID=A0A084IJ52_SALHC|nr:SRPBCC family protein [Salinisphaera hydrothermalis]KEZ76736.1 alcohol dehydrogenase zinc-binding domain-containing protein [Salinisphaera hydrothermalis C41B8]
MERIFISRVIHASPDAVWAVLRDFNGMPEWHPAIADSTIEDGRAADAVGCVRSFHLADGAHLREQLTELSDANRRMRYIILDSPMPVTGYDASIEVLPITEDGGSLVVWTAEFEVPATEAEAMVETVSDGVFRAGLAAIAARLE